MARRTETKRRNYTPCTTGKWQQEHITMACTLREQGLTLGQIVNRFRAIGFPTSANAVGYYCLKFGADLPREKQLPPTSFERAPMRRGNHIVRPFTREEDARLREMDAQGLNFSEMGRRLGRAPNSITGRLATLGRHDARQEDAA